MHFRHEAQKGCRHPQKMHISLSSGPSIWTLWYKRNACPVQVKQCLDRVFFTAAGGKGANQAVAAARLGIKTHMIGCVGDDVFGPQLIDGLRREAIIVDDVEVIGNTSSGIAVIQVERGGENAITVAPGANGLLADRRIQTNGSVIANASAVLLQLEIPIAAVESTLKIAREAGVLTVLDVAPVPPAGLPSSLFQVDVLSPNQHEAFLLTGIDVVDEASAREAAVSLLREGPGYVVIKMGRLGAYCAGEDIAPFHVPAFETEVVDTTAAGDAFTAALAVSLTEGASMKEAVRFGCAAGALAVSQIGAQQAMPRRHEVDARLGL